ncbi:hypothetical protein LINGRAHAP2_LOCUS31665 [Linum grandiflorum]
MYPALFRRILTGVVGADPTFLRRRDAVGHWSISPEVKITAALRMLASGCTADSLDEYFQLGSLNDINIIGQSPVFDRILNGSTPSLRFKVNESWYDTCYYLADGIYPAWSTLVKTIANPTDNKEALFAERQEGYRKDVERAFGILQARWAIVRNPARSWDVPSLKNIMLTCIILHNMIIEDEQVNEFDEMRGDLDYEFFEANMPPNIPPLQQYFARNASIRDGNEHRRLKKDLIEHLWNEAGHGHI